MKKRKKVKKVLCATLITKLLPIFSNNRAHKFYKKPISGNFKKSLEKKPITNSGSRQKVLRKWRMIKEKRVKKRMRS